MFVKKQTIYMDHAAATPIDKDVQKVLRHAEREYLANPGGLHAQAIEARGALEEARARMAELLHARPHEIAFMRGGTEANYVALHGVLNAPEVFEYTKKPHVISTNIEHAVVRDTLYGLLDEGVIEYTELSVNAEGIIEVDELKAALQENTVLVSVMYANNEIGTIQPIRDIMKVVRHWRKRHETQYPLVHTDAIQATNYLNMNSAQLGVDLLVLSGSKIYGPRGMAALYLRKGVPFQSPLCGGDQELGIRPGTEDVAGSLGLLRAVEHALDISEAESLRLQELQQYFFEEIERTLPEARINGSRTSRLPNNVHISLPGVSGERLVIELDAVGIAASAKSACQSNEEGRSHVLEALYGAEDNTFGDVRFSMGRSTRRRDIDVCISALQDIWEKIQEEQNILAEV